MPAQDRVLAHPDSYLAELSADVRAGLMAEPKSLPPKYFYDERGSELFEEITRLPEYYPTRAETAILRARAGEIARLSRCESLVELGSGTSAKTGLLLRALRESGTLREFMPFDVDPAVVAGATEALTTQYPGLRVVPFVGDFERDLGEIPAAKGRRMIAFLGSTIGNLEPPARARNSADPSVTANKQQRSVVYVGATGLPPAVRTWLHLHDSDPDVGRLAARYSEAAREDLDVLAFRVPGQVSRRLLKAAVIQRLHHQGLLAEKYVGDLPDTYPPVEGAAEIAENVVLHTVERLQASGPNYSNARGPTGLQRRRPHVPRPRD
jgi:hypothetical protein